MRLDRLLGSAAPHNQQHRPPPPPTARHNVRQTKAANPLFCIEVRVSQGEGEGEGSNHLLDWLDCPP